MKDDHAQEDMALRNLRDAGCAQAVIEQFMKSCKDKDAVAQIRILSKQRALLLEILHEDQRRLDCLDYLLFQLKKAHCNSPGTRIGTCNRIDRI